jgi:hypothetical protein
MKMRVAGTLRNGSGPINVETIVPLPHSETSGALYRARFLPAGEGAIAMTLTFMIVMNVKKTL